jgi:hypothetical protein
MDRTNRHPADQLALKAAPLLATSSPRPASAHSRRGARQLYSHHQKKRWGASSKE